MICSECWLNIDEEVVPVSSENSKRAAVNVDDSEEVLKEANVPCAENNKSDSDDDFEGPPTKRKLRAYSTSKKIEILKYARNTSIHKASDFYKVDRKRIREWKQNEAAIQASV